MPTKASDGPLRHVDCLTPDCTAQGGVFVVVVTNVLAAPA